jgi:hypothetical protein
MDIEVCRTAGAVVVEHAAAEPGVPVLDPAILDGHDGGAPRVLHVDARVAAVAARVAVVVPEIRLGNKREDEARYRALLIPAGGCRKRRRRQACKEERDECRSGCRPVASHET